MSNVARPHRLLRFARSSIGRKLLMALTGLGMIGFLVGHLAGNLQMFQEAEAINAYAAWLKAHPEVIWPTRLGLLGMLCLHVVIGIQLSTENSAARGPQRYAVWQGQRSNPAGRTMLYSGLILLAFVIFHLAHFTLGLVQPDAFAVVDELGRHDVHSMVVSGFKVPGIAAAYVVAMLVLLFHLFHATRSVWQTLSLNHPAYVDVLRLASGALTFVIALGFAAIPLGVAAGIIGGGK